MSNNSECGIHLKLGISEEIKQFIKEENITHLFFHTKKRYTHNHTSKIPHIKILRDLPGRNDNEILRKKLELRKEILVPSFKNMGVSKDLVSIYCTSDFIENFRYNLESNCIELKLTGISNKRLE